MRAELERTLAANAEHAADVDRANAGHDDQAAWASAALSGLSAETCASKKTSFSRVPSAVLNLSLSAKDRAGRRFLMNRDASMHESPKIHTQVTLST